VSDGLIDQPRPNQIERRIHTQVVDGVDVRLVAEEGLCGAAHTGVPDFRARVAGSTHKRVAVVHRVQRKAGGKIKVGGILCFPIALI